MVTKEEEAGVLSRVSKRPAWACLSETDISWIPILTQCLGVKQNYVTDKNTNPLVQMVWNYSLFLHFTPVEDPEVPP